jgi:molybdate transport repressor ModE-like protein
MNEETIDLNLLRVMKAIELEGSVTAGAQRLGLSQPAVSNALGRMRRVLDDPVFVRSTGGMQATPRGRRLLAAYDAAMGLIRRGLTEGGIFDPASTSSRFVLLLSDVGELVFLPPLMQALAARAPGLHIQARQLARTEHAPALEAGLADLAVGYIASPRGSLRVRPLFQDRFVCMMRTGHPAANEPLTLDRYLDLSHVAVSRHGPERLVANALIGMGAERKTVLSIPHFAAAPTIILRSDLVVTVPSRLVGVFAALGVTSRELPFAVPVLSLSLYWHERQTDDPASRWMRALFVELFAPASRTAPTTAP